MSDKDYSKLPNSRKIIIHAVSDFVDRYPQYKIGVQIMETGTWSLEITNEKGLNTLYATDKEFFDEKQVMLAIEQLDTIKL